MVRATVSCPAGCTSPSRAVQRMRLWSTRRSPARRRWRRTDRTGSAQPGALLQVADGELDRRVVTVNRSTATVGSSTLVMNASVPPVRPQSPLGGVGEAGASHHQTQVAPVASLPVTKVVSATWASPPVVGDRLPCGLVDRLDRRPDLGIDGDGDRPVDLEPLERVDQRGHQNPESACTVSGPLAPDASPVR